MKINIPNNAKKVLDTIHEAGFEAYVVGGCVRDSILGRNPEDWDITTSARPEQVKKLFKRTIDTGIAHGTVTVMIDKEGFEVTTYRIDGEYLDGRHPENVIYTGSLKEDLERRDFTINAMAYNDEEGLVDEFDGLGDIKRKLIRCVGNAEKRFDEDALRIMRAIRFSAQLGYDIDEDTKSAIENKSKDLEKISAERIQTELVKLLLSDHPEKIEDAYKMGITKVILPEFDKCMITEQNNPHHKYTVGYHIIETLKNIRSDRVLRITMLFHDIAKPEKKVTDSSGLDHFKGHPELGSQMTKKIMKRLKFDRNTMDRVCNLILYHDYRFDATPKNVRKAIYKVGEADFPYLIEVKRADTCGQSDFGKEEKFAWIDEIEKVYHQILEDKNCLSLKQLAVNGKDLMEEGIEPGQRIGEILKRMLMDVLEYPEHNTKTFLIENISKFEGKEF
ncbi:MAG: CCA tRNA nucleotidyltransferase [Butyrivibrio sp.]|nr:CCA tRNA nucleotidyltransferase [Butyrivibrio sp.]